MSDLSREFALSCAKCGSHYVNKDLNCANCEKEQGRKDDSVDMVNHPPHYKGESGVECIEVTSKMQFCGGNCFKYLYRAGKKGSTVEDLKKAAWYADKAWENEEVVWHELLENIWAISEYRSGNIKLAMDYIAEDMWADAKRAIECEIQRLENMDVD